MKEWVFLSLSKAYWESAKNGFSYISRAGFLLKPFVLVIALVDAVVLYAVGLIFRLLVIFDWIGGMVDAVRDKLLGTMERLSWQVDNSFLSFLLSPVVLVLVAPVFLLSLFIPKFSSNVAVNFVADELSGIMDGTGLFREIYWIIKRCVNRLFGYILKVPMFMKPFVAVIATGYSLVLIVVGFLFFVLIPLDWFSQMIEKSRQHILDFVHKRSGDIDRSLSGFLINPVLLTVLAPVFLAIILVPKFTSVADSDT